MRKNAPALLVLCGAFYVLPLPSYAQRHVQGDAHRRYHVGVQAFVGGYEVFYPIRLPY